MAELKYITKQLIKTVLELGEGCHRLVFLRDKWNERLALDKITMSSRACSRELRELGFGIAQYRAGNYTHFYVFRNQILELRKLLEEAER